MAKVKNLQKATHPLKDITLGALAEDLTGEIRLVAEGVLNLDHKFIGLEKKVDAIDRRLERVEVKVDVIDDKLSRVEAAVEVIKYRYRANQIRPAQ